MNNIHAIVQDCDGNLCDVCHVEDIICSDSVTPNTEYPGARTICG
jgi:hypothetical protein